MLSFLKNHPFAVEAFFESSLVLTYAVPRLEARHLVPASLELDTFAGEWAFIAAAMVQTKALRPKGFPRIFGNDFFLIGYRIFVKHQTIDGNRLRGLYILKSQTDKRRMELFGNLFTHYNYSTTDIRRQETGDATRICSNASDFTVEFETHDSGSTPLPESSPFANWKEARRFAGPLPFTFTVDASAGSTLVIEGVRQNWSPTPVSVRESHFSFIEGLGFSDLRLANAFLIRNVPYYWKKGRIEK
jgi:uncharacterized protein YqjF (DUF2071 family)